MDEFPKYDTQGEAAVEALKEIRKPQLNAMARARRQRRTLAICVVLLVITNLLTPMVLIHWFIEARSAKTYAVILDESGAFYKTPLHDASTQEGIISYCGLLAAWGVLNRNPKGLDYEKLTDEMFHPQIAARVKTDAAEWIAQTEPMGMHQKVEVQKYEMLQGEEVKGSIIARVRLSGQLIQTGSWGGREERRTPKFELTVKMVRNPFLLTRGRFPWVVTDYKLWIEEVVQ